MYTIGELSKKFQFSRGTLLYYDSIGLLKPSARTAANYRRYSEADAARLKEIRRFRETGMALDDIKQILGIRDRQGDFLLEKRLDELNREMKKLNIQRQIIIGMLRKKNNLKSKSNPGVEKGTLIKVLRNAGLDDAGLDRLHAEYEMAAPEEHQAFLEILGIPPGEILEIREYSKQLLKS